MCATCDVCASCDVCAACDVCASCDVFHNSSIACIYLIIVVCYLVTFRLDELGMKQFRRLIISQSTGKMLKVY